MSHLASDRASQSPGELNADPTSRPEFPISGQVSVRISRLSLAMLACCALTGGGLASLLAVQLTQNARAASDTGRAGLGDILQLSDRFETIARQLSPSVVYVEAAKTARSGKAQAVEESGSGVIVRWPGQPTPLVLTNNHVISQAPPARITVNLSDGRLLKPTRVWTDPESHAAALRIVRGTALPTAVLGDSNQVRVGQWVCLRKPVWPQSNRDTWNHLRPRTRQVSLGSTIRIRFPADRCTSTPVSSGALVDCRQVIINTAIARTAAAIGVCASRPIGSPGRDATPRRECDQGLSWHTGHAGEPADARLGLDRVQGAWIEAVYPGTPAADAGLRAQDVVLQADEISIRNENHFINYISTLQAGQRVQLQVWREGKKVNLTAVVGDWSRNHARFKQDQ